MSTTSPAPPPWSCSVAELPCSTQSKILPVGSHLTPERWSLASGQPALASLPSEPLRPRRWRSHLTPFPSNSPVTFAAGDTTEIMGPDPDLRQLRRRAAVAVDLDSGDPSSPPPSHV